MTLVLVVDRAGMTEERELRGDLTIGRAPENDVVVGDTEASRRHARVEVRGGDVSIIDLGSANGTLLNGVLLQPRLRAALLDGDSFVVGAVKFELRGTSGERAQGRPVLAATRAGGFAEDVRPEPGLASEANYHLTVTTGGETRTVPLSGQVISLGRDARNDIAIDDATVSGRHATLIRSESGGYLIEDQGSTNGLHFAGERIPARQLEHGDVIEVSSTVTLEYRSDRPTPEITKPEPGPAAARIVETGARRELAPTPAPLV